jgi:hypothetical protein
VQTEQIRTRTTTISLSDDGIIYIVFFAGAEERLADAQENVRLGIEMTKGRPAPLLVDMRTMKSQDRDVRDYYNTPEVRRMNTAIALLVGSRISSLIANFFISITSRDSSHPIHIFTEQDAALAWLRGFIK